MSDTLLERIAASDPDGYREWLKLPMTQKVLAGLRDETIPESMPIGASAHHGCQLLGEYSGMSRLVRRIETVVEGNTIGQQIDADYGAGSELIRTGFCHSEEEARDLIEEHGGQL